LRDTWQGDNPIRTVVEHCSFEARPALPTDRVPLLLLLLKR
jgi:hypothetical protein